MRSTARREALSSNLVKLFGSALPESEGMVRISSSPPTTRSQSELAYDERYFDVPAARVTEGATSEPPQSVGRLVGTTPVMSREGPVTPLTVPLDKPFSSSGHGVVSQRTANHVGFNGFTFRRANGYPELKAAQQTLLDEHGQRVCCNRSA